MIEKLKTKKYYYRIISMILSLVMSVNLLSGCASGTGAETSAQAGTVTEEAQAESSQELLNSSLDALYTEVSEGSMEEAEALYEQVKTNLDLMSEEAEGITDTSGIMDSLSSDAQVLLSERTESFNEELAENREETEELSEALATSLASGDTEKTLSLIEEIKDITEGETENSTYGVTPGAKAAGYEASECELTEYEAAAKAAVYETEEAALLYDYDSELVSCTGITSLNEEMKALADELTTPLEIYNYLKTHIGYEYYYGSRKGAEGTYNSMNGNDVDQASLLIAMLRYKGYPAMYVHGDIRITPDQAISLTGADTAEHAADVLASNGVPVTKLTSSGQVVYIEIEHVWVRTLVPYGNYRGAGAAEGEAAWIDLDTGIKEYEAVNSIYDMADRENISIQLDEAIASDNMDVFNTLYSDYSEACEALLSESDSEDIYVRKRIIKQTNESYLPLSLQYEVESENESFAELPDSLRDTISFEVNGYTIAQYRADELSGKSILLSYEAATDKDAEILSAYGDLFSTPSYAVNMTPVLYVNGEAVSDSDEEFLYSTLGRDSSFSIVFSTKDGKTYIDNTITTGSMFAVTLDVQSIDDIQLESIYNEAAAYAADAVMENVYSPEYMGRYLEFTGKLYFAQLDLTYTMAAESYDMAVTRNLSEGITGYEVKKEYLYGTLSGIDFGHMFMDVDMDSHSAASLYGDDEAKKEYLFTTGIMGSIYESGIFEELTGEQAVSTMSIFEEALANGTDILAVNSSNLEDGLSLINTSAEVVSDIRNAVNDGYTVFVPCEDVVMGSWSGTGYIVLEAETGTASYMISGGLNGGSTEGEVLYYTMLDFGLTLIDITEGLLTIFQAINYAKTVEAIAFAAAGQAVAAGLCIGLSIWSCTQTFELYNAYMAGNEEIGELIVKQTIFNAVLTFGLTVFTALAKPVLKLIMKNKLIKTLGADVLEELISNGATIEELSKLTTNLRKLGLSDDIISAFAKNFGESGLDFLRQARGLNVSTDLLMELSKLDSIANRMDYILELIRGSSRSADEVAECIIKHGDEAMKFIGDYGDYAVDAIIKCGDDAIDFISKYGNDAAYIIGKYGDDAVDELKNGRVPYVIREDYEGITGNGSLSDERIQSYLYEGVHYKGSKTVILGSTGKYNETGEENKYTYFKITDELWFQLTIETNKNYDEIWKINKQFLDDQIAAGKRILLGNDPYVGYYLDNGAKRFYQRELDYLQELGYEFKKVEGDFWEAVKGGS